MLAVSIARHHWRSLVGTFVALALGITLLSTTMIIFASATAQPPVRYAAAEILVSSQPPGATTDGAGEFRPWTDQRADHLAASIDQLPGVRTAVVDRSFHAQLTVNGRLVTSAEERDRQGHNWSSTLLAGDLNLDGAAPASPDQVVVGRKTGLPVGARAQLLLPTRTRTVQVSGVVDGSGVFLQDAAAASGSAGPQVIGVVLDHSSAVPAVQKKIRAVVRADGQVYSGAARAKTELGADASNRHVGSQFLLMMGAVSAFVSIFVVATTFAFVVSQRRRELGLLRAVGATPGQVRRMLIMESLVVGLPASVFGAGLGAVLAPVISQWMITNQMQSPSWEPRQVLLPMLGAIMTGLLVALAGVWSASRQAARVRPIEALRIAAVERRPMTVTRWIFGLMFMIISVVLAGLTQGLTFGNVGALTVGAASAGLLGATLLAPAYLPWLIRLVCAPFRRQPGATMQLVREGSLAGVRRVASTMAPVLVTMGFVVFITGMVATMSDTIDRSTVRQIPTAQVVAPAQGSPGLTDATLATVRHAHPTREMSELSSSVVVDGHWMDATGLDAGVRGQPAAGGPQGDLAAIDRPGTIALNQRAADLEGWEVGDRVPLVWADGTTGTLEVTAIVGGNDLAATALVSRERLRAHDRGALTPVAYVDGLSADRLGSALAPLGADLVAATDYQNNAEQEEEQLFRVFVLFVLALAIGYTTLAIINTLVMATADRRRDFAVLRLTGALPRQIFAVVTIEAGIVVLAGALIGTLAAIPAVYGIGSWLAADLGVAARVVFDWPMVAITAAGCLLLALAASLAPARAALRTPAVRTVGSTD